LEIAPDVQSCGIFRDSQQDTYMICRHCGGEIYSEEQIYQWSTDGCDLCEECFVDHVRNLPPVMLAGLLGLRHEEVRFMKRFAGSEETAV